MVGSGRVRGSAAGPDGPWRLLLPAGVEHAGVVAAARRWDPLLRTDRADVIALWGGLELQGPLPVGPLARLRRWASRYEARVTAPAGTHLDLTEDQLFDRTHGLCDLLYGLAGRLRGKPVCPYSDQTYANPTALLPGIVRPPSARELLAGVLTVTDVDVSSDTPGEVSYTVDTEEGLVLEFSADVGSAGLPHRAADLTADAYTECFVALSGYADERHARAVRAVVRLAWRAGGLAVDEHGFELSDQDAVEAVGR